jgi:DNA helicase IV
MIDLLEEQTSFIRFRLTINCRNTKTICDEICFVTDFKAPSEVWSKVNGLPVQYLTYSSKDEGRKKLTDTVKTLLENHISPKKICILSPLKRENSIVSEITEYDIKEYKTFSNNALLFCTIQAYKGLENSVIILVDIESISDKQLMYVALSRARSGLYIIESEAARKEYVDLQARRLSNGYKT